MIVSTNRSLRVTAGLGLALALAAASVPCALAQSWKINNGRNTGALLPTETRGLMGRINGED